MNVEVTVMPALFHKDVDGSCLPQALSERALN